MPDSVHPDPLGQQITHFNKISVTLSVTYNLQKIWADKSGCSQDLLHNLDGNVHAPISLRQSLVIGESEFSKLMKRLNENSLIYSMSACKNGKKYKWIMLNPTLARKSKAFHKDCREGFDDLSKKSIVNS